MAIEIATHAHYGFRPWCARVTGLDRKYGFAREFLRGDRDYSRSGKTHDVAWYLDRVGLYQVGGTKRDNGWWLVVRQPNGKLIAHPISDREAHEIANIIDEKGDDEETYAALAAQYAPQNNPDNE